MDTLLSVWMALNATVGGILQVFLAIHPLVALVMISATLIYLLPFISRRLEKITWLGFGAAFRSPSPGFRLVQRYAFGVFAIPLLQPEVTFALRIQRIGILIGVTLLTIGAVMAIRKYADAGKTGEGVSTWLLALGFVVIVIGIGSCLVGPDCFLPGRGLGMLDTLTSDFPDR